MNVYTKYFIAVFSVFNSHTLLGFSSAYAMQCEREIEEQWANAPVRDNGKKDMPALWHNGRGYATLEEAKAKWFDEIMDAINNSDRKWADPYYGSMTCQAYAVKWVPIYLRRNEPGAACTAQYMAQTNCQNPEVFKYKKGSSQQSSSSSSNSSNARSTNQASKKSKRQATTASPSKVQESTNTSNESGSSQPQPDAMSSIFDALDVGNNKSGTSKSEDLTKMNSDELIDLLKSTENSGDYAKSYAIEQQLAKDSNPYISRQGIRRLGVRYFEGIGVNKDISKAIRHFETASNMGDVDAANNLCLIYVNGNGVKENHQKALGYCQTAAEKGEPLAQANIAWLLGSSKEIQQNKPLSDMWTCKAAAQGEPTAVNNVKKASIRCN